MLLTELFFQMTQKCDLIQNAYPCHVAYGTSILIGSSYVAIDSQHLQNKICCQCLTSEDNAPTNSHKNI